MSKLRAIRPYVMGALGFAAVIAIVSPDARSAAAALVFVTNTSANPVPTKAADNPALSAWGVRVYPNVRAPVLFTVPAGKYLVINDVSGFTNGSTAYDVEIGVTTNGGGSGKLIPFGPRGIGGWAYLVNTNTFLVADPGSTVAILIEDTDFNDGAGINVDLHGYYVSQN
ncbi:MAG TPA: hypothetical protein VMN79_04440 [Casimicrobiaceae bacterium]|nr:hypothetical protein [Casimicrobiaceae bacterium]